MRGQQVQARVPTQERRVRLPQEATIVGGGNVGSIDTALSFGDFCRFGEDGRFLVV